jgi:type III secretory pathway component EscV
MAESEAERIRQVEERLASMATRSQADDVAARLDAIQSDLRGAMTQLDEASRKRREALKRISEIHGLLRRTEDGDLSEDTGREHRAPDDSG